MRAGVWVRASVFTCACVYLCACACKYVVCVCARARAYVCERERERQRERDTERERDREFQYARHRRNNESIDWLMRKLGICFLQKLLCMFAVGTMQESRETAKIMD